MEPPPVGSQQRWAAFAQFVPDWVAFKANRGNGVCDPLEECRTDPACCVSSAADCGNGLCEEGETWYFGCCNGLDHGAGSNNLFIANQRRAENVTATDTAPLRCLRGTHVPATLIFPTPPPPWIFIFYRHRMICVE